MPNSLTMDEQHYAFEEGVHLNAKEEEYLLKHFFTIVVGKPGSGKT